MWLYRLYKKMGFKIYLAFCWLKNAFSGKSTNYRGLIVQGKNRVFPYFLFLKLLIPEFFSFL
ncbi:hypothetical protein DU86_07490 [Methanosarcina mazei]|uniref:Uncharacterized protein n=1 Tax=Methanosarcina mazei TaxID=2209 RepID=A0A0F8SW14_METMZ|nr:hypothetical protein DU67_16160 [Methanosarcina mazei]KKG83575.1 hypothetical protein DU55_11530 [Methanosarcina mazei]KKH34646.1 hypothetical protein DU50_04085 [Methanosarcina mazei]KKH53882.1 hypothetical protein DU76_05970 [Methanosarcina mazei]KKH63700.1 hypothetical protein DU87_07125 [Methanosarcina mazei]